MKDIKKKISASATSILACVAGARNSYGVKKEHVPVACPVPSLTHMTPRRLLRRSGQYLKFSYTEPWVCPILRPIQTPKSGRFLPVNLESGKFLPLGYLESGIPGEITKDTNYNTNRFILFLFLRRWAFFEVFRFPYESYIPGVKTIRLRYM